MTREELEAALAPDQNWKVAYPAVEAEARRILDAMAPGAERITTAQLVESIYPAGELVRGRVFRALEACASHGLAAYVELGPQEKIGLVSGRRKLWGPARTSLHHDCPHCKRPL